MMHLGGQASKTGRRDAGFTIIELCIAIALLGVVMLVITGTMFTAARVNAQTERRLGLSYDLQRATMFFAQDVYGAEQVVPGPTLGCGSVAPIVTFRQDSFDAADPTKARVTQVSYVWDAPGKSLIRVECTGDSVTTLALGPALTLTRHVTASPALECLDESGAQVPSCLPLPAKVQLLGLSIDGATHTLTGTRRNLWCMSTDSTPVPTTSCDLDPIS